MPDYMKYTVLMSTICSIMSIVTIVAGHVKNNPHIQTQGLLLLILAILIFISGVSIMILQKLEESEKTDA